MREDGIMPSDISKQMEIHVDLVNAVLLNTRKKINRANDPDDPITAMRQELALLQLQQQKQEMIWKNEDRELKRQEALQEQFYGDVDEDQGHDPTNTMLMMFLQSFMQGKAAAAPSPVSPVPPAPPTMELDDDAIMEIIEQYPRESAILAKMPGQMQFSTLKSRFPQLADSTIRRGLEILNKNKTEGEHGKTKILSTGKK